MKNRILILITLLLSVFSYGQVYDFENINLTEVVEGSDGFKIVLTDSTNNGRLIKSSLSITDIETLIQNNSGATGTPGQVAYFDSGGDIAGDTNFQWDEVNDRIQISNIASPVFAALFNDKFGFERVGSGNFYIVGDAIAYSQDVFLQAPDDAGSTEGSPFTIATLEHLAANPPAPSDQQVENAYNSQVPEATTQEMQEGESEFVKRFTPKLVKESVNFEAARYNGVNLHGDVSGNVEIDYNLYTIHKMNMTGDITFIVSNPPPLGNGRRIIFYITGTGEITFPSNFKKDVTNSVDYDPSMINRYVIDWMEETDVVYTINNVELELFDPEADLAIYSWRGVTTSGTTVTSVSDQSGNGYDFVGSGSPQVAAGSLGNKQAIIFDGSNGLQMLSTMAERSNLTKLAGWCVYKITAADGTVYHNIVAFADDYTSVNNFMHIYSPNSTDEIIQNPLNTNLDTTIPATLLDPHYVIFDLDGTDSQMIVDGADPVVKLGSQNMSNQGIFLGQWNDRGAIMEFYELVIFDNNTNVLTTEKIEQAKIYFQETYGIDPLASSAVEVLNQGVSGNNTANVKSRLSTINSKNADLAIVMIGVNDWRHPSSSKRLTTAQYETNLTDIVQSLKANGSDVLLVKFPPILEAETDYVCGFYGEPTGCDVNATGAGFLTKISDVATAESTYVLDVNQLFINEGEPTELAGSFIQNTANTGSADGVHLTPIGNQFLADQIDNFLTTNNLSYTNIVCVGDSTTFGFGVAGAGTNTGDTYPAKLKVLLND